ncbi:G2/mitotic-specific cyclin-B-like, partial [Haematobia irritans]|uniref:G2/mitotic-specific cyclin-B-like n=1 Tax=Haematobia irritans TaxID=7368 RepID=UPI003F4FB0AD
MPYYDVVQPDPSIEEVKKGDILDEFSTYKSKPSGVMSNKAYHELSLKDTKLQNVLRATKARVDTHWKKTTTTTTTVGGATRTNVATGETVTTAVAAQRKVLTRSNSVRLGTSSTTTTGLGGLQRHASTNSHLQVGQNKVKTLTTKMVENKVQQVKIINKTSKTDSGVTVETTLRREDSNLSRKSLTKLKAAISQNAKQPLAKSNSGTTLNRKEVKTEPTNAAAATAPTEENKLKIISVQSHSTKLLDDVKDIDDGDSENLILVSDYVNDIYAYLFKLETE